MLSYAGTSILRFVLFNGIHSNWAQIQDHPWAGMNICFLLHQQPNGVFFSGHRIMLKCMLDAVNIADKVFSSKNQFEGYMELPGDLF